MVVTMFWMQSWITLAIAVVSLITLVLFIFFCTCFDRKKESRLYVIDEKGTKRNNAKKEVTTNSTYSLNIFRRLSSHTEPENVFSSINLPFYKLKKANKDENDLAESFETTKSFDNLILKFKETDVSSHGRDELRSCASAESLNSFYSAHPSTIARETSRESFVSLISECEADNLIV